jgi:hypothetical protein
MLMVGMVGTAAVHPLNETDQEMAVLVVVEAVVGMVGTAAVHP